MSRPSGAWNAQRFLDRRLTPPAKAVAALRAYEMLWTFLSLRTRKIAHAAERQALAAAVTRHYPRLSHEFADNSVHSRHVIR